MKESSASALPKVKLAVQFIWASFAINVLSWVLVLFAPVPEHVKQKAAELNVSVTTFTLTKFAGLAISGIIIYLITNQLMKGKNWARILCLLAGIIALPDAIFRFLSHNDTTLSLMSIGINTLYLGFAYFALYLLFTRPGKDWFKKYPKQSQSFHSG